MSRRSDSAPRGIVSIGYEGRTLEDFIVTLRAEGVAVLVDVRLNAISRKPGFSKTALKTAALAAGIDYVHEPLLGNPIDNRDDFRAGYKRARTRYRKRLEGASSEAVDRVIALAVKQRVAVLCVERDHTVCHRDELINVALERRQELLVTHLDYRRPPRSAAEFGPTAFPIQTAFPCRGKRPEPTRP